MEKIKSLPLVRDYQKTQLWIKALITFSVGFLIAPLSYSLLWFLVYLVVFEVVIAMYAGFDFYTRFVMVTASITGWILGRLIVQMNPFADIENLLGI